jgi:hypothetical protein
MAGEGALKLKEVCYVHAEGMAAGELKHGTLALIEEGTPVVAICPTDYTYADIFLIFPKPWCAAPPSSVSRTLITPCSMNGLKSPRLRWFSIRLLPWYLCNYWLITPPSFGDLTRTNPETWQNPSLSNSNLSALITDA